MTDKGSSSSKRKASAAFIPDSFASYLMGALRDNFDHLKTHIQKDCDFVATKGSSGHLTKQILEELFRYLYLLADSSTDEVVRTSPSYFVDQAFHCLLLDPVLYWKVCNEILNMKGRDIDDVHMRVLSYDALDNRDDEGRYNNTLAKYKETYGEDPPKAIWGDYKPAQPNKNQTTGVSQPHEVTSSTLPGREQSLKDIIRLRIVGSYGKSFDMEVSLGEKFSSVIDRLASHQQLLSRQITIKYRLMMLRGYMMPYTFNMKDGDIIRCNIPLFSARKIAKRAAAAAAAAVSQDTTATNIDASPTTITTVITSTTTAPSIVPSIFPFAGSLADYAFATDWTKNNPTNCTETAATNASSLSTASATATTSCSSADNSVDINTRPRVVVSNAENLCLMGWPERNYVKLVFYHDIQNVPKGTTMLVRDGTVLLGEVFAAYVQNEGFPLADCTFFLNGVTLDPEALVSTVAYWWRGMHSMHMCARSSLPSDHDYHTLVRR